MIDVQNVSMRFNLGIEKNNSLKQMAVDLFSKSAREKRKMHKKENEFWALQDVSFKVEKDSYIYNKVEKLVKKFKTRDPFEILEEMNVIVGETDRYEKLKGYCFMSCQTIYVMVSSFLSEEEKKIVAAHELGHIILHRSQLKMAPMKDDVLYNMRDNTEYEANLFAADLILDDKEIADLSKNEDLNYFGLCSCLNSSPELMSFKLYSLIKRGQNYNMPLEIQSNFLAK